LAPLLAFWLLGLLLGGCGSEQDLSATPPAQSKNLFANGSFEEGERPWWFFTDREYWAGFSITDAYAVEGRHSAHLALRARPQDQGTKIWGLIQEVMPPTNSPFKFLRLPKRLSGYYRVENWQRATEKQYLQFVLILWGDPDPSIRREPNIQIRYLLAGVSAQPIEISNARFVVLGPQEPPQGEWVHFERDLHKDFLELWGHVPQRVEKMRVLFEVRYDGKQAGAGEGTADVYFDGLYLGD